MPQLVELQETYSVIRSLNAELLAISIDDISNTIALSNDLNASYSILSDPDACVIKEYGVFNLLGDGLATPSVFIINSNKIITWSYVGENLKDRVRVEDILFNIPSK
jgi:peroxiredoxin|tara:strand:+ start:607 stop:927 length:321 start_codon:yes stop_codon:yes gene_type:complete